jgi:hypothetical protein
MFRRLKSNFDSGVERIKWFSSIFSDRLKIEFSVIKLLYHSTQMEQKRDDLMKKIGQRVYELKEQSDRQVMKDRIILETFSEIERINNEIESTKKKASEISST